MRVRRDDEERRVVAGAALADDMLVQLKLDSLPPLRVVLVDEELRGRDTEGAQGGLMGLVVAEEVDQPIGSKTSAFSSCEKMLRTVASRTSL